MVRSFRRRLEIVDRHAVARVAAGGVWLAGAAFNVLVTLRMDDPYGWLAEGSRLGVYRWFFDDIIGAHPAFWTASLVAGETALGVLTLSRGRWAVWGLAGGAAFSGLLFSLATPYTVGMGAYALYLVWLAQEQHRRNQAARPGREPQVTTAAKPLPPRRGSRPGLKQVRS